MIDYEKKIYLYDDKIGSVAYVDHMGTDLTIVNSARVSYGVTKTELDTRDRKLIKYLVRNKHTSTFEHNVVTFKFVVPLYIRSQHHRHRTWSYNEISRRYTSKELQFYNPECFRAQHKTNKQASVQEERIDPVLYPTPGYSLVPTNSWTANKYYKSHVKSSVKLYNEMINKGVCREQARGVLPQCLYTEYYGTCNLSNLLKFIDLRLHEHSQWEIQRVAQSCLEIAQDLWPEAVKHYRDIKYGESEFSQSKV